MCKDSWGVIVAESNGLLDFLNTPAGMGLLSAVGSGLAGARRGGTMNAVGSGLLGGVQGFAQAQDQAMQKKRFDSMQQMSDLQFKQLQQAQADQDAIRGLAKSSYTPPSMTMSDVMSAPGAAGPTTARADMLPKTQGTFDTQGFINGVMGVNPIEGMKLRASLAKESHFNKIDPKDFDPSSIAKFAQTGNYGDLVPARKMELTPGGQVWNPYQAQPGQAFADPNRLFSLGADGKPVPNTSLQSFELQKARAGKTDVNLAVNTEKSLLTTMGEGLGKQLDASLAGAQSAQNTINTAGQIKQLVESGKVITGPGADYRVTLARLGEALGVGGKDNSEKLANTAQLVQGLAKTELDSAKSIAGQGPVTDFERALIRRAAAGDLSMTGSELKTLASALDKSGRARIKQHQTQVQRLQQMPGAAPLIPFYSVDAPAGNVVDFGSLR